MEICKESLRIRRGINRIFPGINEEMTVGEVLPVGLLPHTAKDFRLPVSGFQIGYLFPLNFHIEFDHSI